MRITNEVVKLTQLCVPVTDAQLFGAEKSENNRNSHLKINKNRNMFTHAEKKQETTPRINQEAPKPDPSDLAPRLKTFDHREPVFKSRDVQLVVLPPPLS